MELIPVVQETLDGTMILWDDIPAIYYRMGINVLETDLYAYRHPHQSFLMTTPEQVKKRTLWLENRIAQLKLVKLLEDD